MLGRDLIQTVDFNALYRAQCRRSSFGARPSADWDRRAAHRQRGEGGGDYMRAVLARIDFSGVQTALDIGCGTGNLAIPLAQRLRQVTALDFSAEMLRYLEINRARAGLDNLVAKKLSWTDAWRGVPRADLVVCSRALGVDDLRAALAKMHRWAKRRCVATLHVGGSFLGPEVLALLDRDFEPRPDYIYAVNVLYQMGIRAKVDFIRSGGGTGYASAKEFVAAVRWRVGALSRAEDARLRKFFAELPPDAAGRRAFRRDFIWALLAWEKEPR